ncbi:hypothetical protein [Thalassotalea sediminis]|uniref:hypothetical protein n=1 Tax=Thalassotalea sediminis TaxID=1759089 RepID=UPI002573BBA2|nr:hypothetical protein [Thalassotalea sediminis]
MRGLYINCDDTNIPASAELAKQYSKKFVFPSDLGQGQVIFSPDEWPDDPIYSYKNNTFIVAGWFIYKQKRNNLAELAADIYETGVEVVENILAGSFLLYWWDGATASVIVDPFGISSHYIDLHSKTIRIAPSVKVLYDPQSHTHNALQQSILEKKHHLFGDFTIYDGIERLTPGHVFNSQGKTPYTKLIHSQYISLEEVGIEVRELASYWHKNNCVLPLSSGLDSRFILANNAFKNGFTYGPKNSPEITIAGKFKEDFDNYYAYDFSEPKLHLLEAEINREMSFGVLKPIERLLTNYAHVKAHFKNVFVFFDGYCGDVFQRGTFINFKGVQGELLKIFPWVYPLLKWDARKILRKRHSVLTDEEFEVIYNDFHQKTSSLALDDLQKVTYYEFLFGRGGRYAVFGSNILCAQFFSVVSPFAQKHIFNAVIHQNFYDSIKYKSMKRLWRNLPEKYKKEKVESGYSLNTNVMLIPFIQIIYRIMFHLMPSRANYGVKMRREEKKKR